VVINGFAGAGTIEMSGLDYHGQGTRPPARTATSGGVCIGALPLSNAARVGMPLMLYIFSDGSLNAERVVDNTPTAAASSWASDNQTTAASIILVI